MVWNFREDRFNVSNNLRPVNYSLETHLVVTMHEPELDNGLSLTGLQNSSASPKRVFHYLPE